MAQERTEQKTSSVTLPTPEDFGTAWPEDVGCQTWAERVNEINPHLRLVEGETRPKGGGEWGFHKWNVDKDGTIVDGYYETHPYAHKGETEYREDPEALDRWSKWQVEREDVTKTLSRILSDPVPPTLPPKEQKVGASTVAWWEPNPREAVIMAMGGTVDDRTLAEQLVKTALAAFGFTRVAFKIESDNLKKESGWTDIMAKAKRLIQSGQVHVLRNGWNNIVGHVIGDHGEYNVEIGRDDPASRTITTWTCECPWDQYAWQRTRKWKKYEGRPCSHVMALYWTSFGVPMDDYDPNVHGDLPPGQTPPPKFPRTPGAPTPPPEPMAPAAPGPPSPFSQPTPDATLGPAGPGPQAPLAPPGQPGVLPPAPMDMMQQAMQPPPMPGQTPPGMPAPPGSVSVPGARLPSPFGPVQYPGGTYSRVAAGEVFVNGEIVRLTTDAYGMNEGREGATDAGQYTLIPEGSTGEVIGQDPATGWVEAIFPLEGGPMTSYHARCFVEPGDLKKTRIRPPGPFIKRRR